MAGRRHIELDEGHVRLSDVQNSRRKPARVEGDSLAGLQVDLGVIRVMQMVQNIHQKIDIIPAARDVVAPAAVNP